ncbi:hypothetical protein HDU98_009740 [Podochytrium sp. JEL0797]|nr:hypothetical protein HDU98_009740 [Podochytrium sp. JEL0797]
MDDLDQLLNDLETASTQPAPPPTEATDTPAIPSEIPVFVTTTAPKSAKSIFQSRKKLVTRPAAVASLAPPNEPPHSSESTLCGSTGSSLAGSNTPSPTETESATSHTAVAPSSPTLSPHAPKTPLSAFHKPSPLTHQPPTPTSAPKICHTCHDAITTPSFITTTHGHTYHPTHFTCANPPCQRLLKGTLYIERDTDGTSFCKPCFTALFSETCAYCATAIVDTCVKAVGKTFHADCFFCSHCGDKLSSATRFVEEQGKVYCLADYESLYARACAGCGKKTGTSSADGTVTPLVQVSKDQVFHLDCFKCSRPGCTLLLSPNEFYQGSGGEPICQMHYYQMQDAVCCACDKVVIGACVNALGKRYHRGCFACTFCKQSFDKGQAGVPGGSGADRFKSKNGNPYCCLCHTKLFG